MGILGTGIYNPPGTTNANVPSSRAYAAAWTDAAGSLWLFGGDAVAEDVILIPQQHNHLWKYTPSTNTWLWLSGSDAASPPAVFGTQGVASNTNVPSGREMAASWIDANGKLWLWGGMTMNGNLSDVRSVAPQ
jgi:hypothetical protein